MLPRKRKIVAVALSKFVLPPLYTPPPPHSNPCFCLCIQFPPFSAPFPLKGRVIISFAALGSKPRGINGQDWNRNP